MRANMVPDFACFGEASRGAASIFGRGCVGAGADKKYLTAAGRPEARGESSGLTEEPMDEKHDEADEANDDAGQDRPIRPEDQDPKLWKGDGWTARVLKNEDDEGWAVAMT